MKNSLLNFLFSLFFILVTNQFNQAIAQNTDYTKIYKSLTPNEFLNHLMKYTKFKFVTYGESPIDWIKEKDIEVLIARVYDTTSIPSIVNPLSSYVPNKKSCIGREAQNMIEAYKNKESYLHFLYSYGSVNTLNAKKLMNWYKNK